MNLGFRPGKTGAGLQNTRCLFISVQPQRPTLLDLAASVETLSVTASQGPSSLPICHPSLKQAILTKTRRNGGVKES